MTLSTVQAGLDLRGTWRLESVDGSIKAAIELPGDVHSALLAEGRIPDPYVGRYELDLVAIDPGPPAALVIVEVRWRAGRGFGLPEETVDHRKRTRVRAAAYGLLDRGTLPDGSPLPRLPLRFDLVVVEPGDRIRHHRAAF